MIQPKKEKKKKNTTQIPIVYPVREDQPASPSENLLKVVFDKRPVDVDWDNFDTIRKRIETQWETLPPKYDVISDEMKNKMKIILEAQRILNENSTKDGHSTEKR